MNNKLVVLIIIVFTAVLVGGMWFFFKISLRETPTPNTNTNIPTGGQTNTGNNNGGTVPVLVPTQNGTTTEQGIIVAAQGGNSMVVKDFKKDTETEAYPDKSLYYLSGGLTPTINTTPYSIFYAEADQSFHITLLKTPLKEMRKQAEQALLKKLGLTEAQACNLVVYVGTPGSVSEEYAGMELGLSFCPGAVAL